MTLCAYAEEVSPEEKVQRKKRRKQEFLDSLPHATNLSLPTSEGDLKPSVQVDAGATFSLYS